MKLLKYNNGKIFHFLSNGPGFNPKNNCFSVIIFSFTLSTVSAAILMLSSMYACLKWRVLKWHEKRSFPLFQEWKRRHLILCWTKVHSMLKNTKCIATLSCNYVLEKENFAKLTSNDHKYEFYFIKEPNLFKTSKLGFSMK